MTEACIVSDDANSLSVSIGIYKAQEIAKSNGAVAVEIIFGIGAAIALSKFDKVCKVDFAIGIKVNFALVGY